MSLKQIRIIALLDKRSNGAFTLLDTDTDTVTDRKMGCMELCGSVHTARQTQM